MRNRPVIGLLGLMTDGYEETFPGIMAQQKAYGEELATSLSPYMDVVFERIGGNRREIEEIVKDYNCRELDGILIVLLAYSQGAWLLNAMRENRLPVALAVLQPDDVAEEEFVELDLTRNQGIHGAQDNCNILMRLGIPYEVYAGSRNEARFFTFAENSVPCGSVLWAGCREWGISFWMKQQCSASLELRSATTVWDV